MSHQKVLGLAVEVIMPHQKVLGQVVEVLSGHAEVLSMAKEAVGRDWQVVRRAWQAVRRVWQAVSLWHATIQPQRLAKMDRFWASLAGRMTVGASIQASQAGAARMLAGAEVKRNPRSEVHGRRLMESPLFLSDLLTGPELPREFTKTGNRGLLVSIPGLAKFPGRFMSRHGPESSRRLREARGSFFGSQGEAWPGLWAGVEPRLDFQEGLPEKQGQVFHEQGQFLCGVARPAQPCPGVA